MGTKQKIKMQLVLKCLPELRDIRGLSEQQRQKNMREASPRLTECLFQIALNLVYSGSDYNGIALSTAHVQRLKKHKKSLTSLIKTKSHQKRKKVLKKGGVIVELLSVLAGVIATLVAAL